MTQRFLQGVEQDSQQRTEKMDAVLKALRPKRRKLTKEEADLFFARLQADSERRNRSRCVNFSIWHACCSSLCPCTCDHHHHVPRMATCLVSSNPAASSRPVPILPEIRTCCDRPQVASSSSTVPRTGRAEAIQAARDQEVASMELARKMLAETLTRTRPKSAGRPGSASMPPASGAPSLSQAPRPSSARPA